MSITRRSSRNQLVCIRDDGTSTIADLGPNVPYHDLAHLVVERKFGLKNGFFGNIARGYSPQQLSDKDVILSLGKEPYRAEVLARALASLQTGACTLQQFETLVNAELQSLSLSEMHIASSTIEAMSAEYRQLAEAFAALQAGESLELDFSE